MEQTHADELESDFEIPARRITLLGTFDPKRRGPEIDDPFFSYNEQTYRNSYKLIRDCIVGYLETADELK